MNTGNSGPTAVAEPETKTYRPLRDYVLLRKVEVVEERGGIFVGHVENPPPEGYVEAVGPEVWGTSEADLPLFSVGDRVLYREYGGVVLEDDERLLIRAADILAVVE